MESLYSTADIIRKVGLLTLLGFLIVFLIGPVLQLVKSPQMTRRSRSTWTTSSDSS